jgi:hypothetical protein
MKITHLFHIEIIYLWSSRTGKFISGFRRLRLKDIVTCKGDVRDL